MASNNTLSIFDPASFIPQQTVSYRTFLKTAFVQALSEVYSLIPDPILQTVLDADKNKLSGVSVTMEYPTNSIVYPCIVVKWLEQSVRNIGVGHIEMFEDPNTGLGIPFRHAHYQGQIELGVYTLSSLDNSLVSDSLVQIMRMPDMATYTSQYFNQIFNDVDNSNTVHYINVDTDNIRPIGESASQTPWLAENEFQYKSGYRANVLGEFYSLPPDFTPDPPLTAVEVFPYVLGVDPIPDPDPSDPALWQPPGLVPPST